MLTLKIAQSGKEPIVKNFETTMGASHVSSSYLNAYMQGFVGESGQYTVECATDYEDEPVIRTYEFEVNQSTFKVNGIEVTMPIAFKWKHFDEEVFEGLKGRLPLELQTQHVVLETPLGEIWAFDGIFRREVFEEGNTFNAPAKVIAVNKVGSFIVPKFYPYGCLFVPFVLPLGTMIDTNFEVVLTAEQTAEKEKQDHIKSLNDNIKYLKKKIATFEQEIKQIEAELEKLQ